MSWGFVAVAGATVVGGALSADAQRSAGNRAADAQTRAAELGVEEQRRQFDALQELLAPYAESGEEALRMQRELIGVDGIRAQNDAINRLQRSPEFQARVQQGENAILQNAAATGGLRGGNVQNALAQFRPQITADLINQQYARLGGLSSLGQNAAAMTGNAGQNAASNISNLYGQQGAAQAGAALASGQATANFANQLSGLAGLWAGTYGGLGGQQGGKF